MYNRTVVRTIVTAHTKNDSTYYSHDVLWANTNLDLDIIPF